MCGRLPCPRRRCAAIRKRVALRGECGAQYAGDLGFVVDDENLRGLIVFVRFHSRSECWVTMWTSTLGDSFRKC